MKIKFLKKKIVLVGLLSLFLIIGIFFSYFRKPFLAGMNDQKSIYYLSKNNLYLIKPDVTNPTPQEIISVDLQSVGKIIDISIDKKNAFSFFTAAISEDNTKIWKAYLEQKTFEKSFSDQTPGLENFKNFRKPIISPDNQKVAFIASRSNTDNIFVMNLKNEDLVNFSGSVYEGNISCYDWSTDSQKIVFVDTKTDKNSIKMISLDRQLKNIYDTNAQITQVNSLKEGIVFLEQSNDSSVNLLNLSSGQVTSLIDYSYPKEISQYNLSSNKQFIVYETRDLVSLKTDLFKINIDGSNLLEIAGDGNSQSPIISAQSSRIAFWVKDTGIIIVDTNKTWSKKVLLSKEIIDNLIVWR